ncbi:MAG: glycine/sarcosine/betaine reductase complex component subunit beta [Actinomycetota bacterium]|jgi:betaine reductase|nr:glycine/sarcosine/betaine reductase complex component subunit beta [Actinomycetota bacterium]
MSEQAVITASTQVLAHVPGLTEHGSKPRRELPRSEEVAADFAAALRSYDDAVGYGPHQAYLNAVHPRDLPPRPWVGHGLPGVGRFAPAGEIMPEDEFLGLMAIVDDFGLLSLSPAVAERAASALAGHPLAKAFDLDRLDKAAADLEAVAAEPGSTRIGTADDLRAVMRWGEGFDESLTSVVLLDNLAAKATATLALLHLLDKTDVDPLSIPYVLGCGEEAIGDRYQRGGGNMGKTVAEKGGLLQASGADIKNFCAAPVPALVMAGALVSSGVFDRVAVIAGGSMAKLGMKFQGHLKNGLPILEDVLGGTAALVERADAATSAGRHGPRIRLDAVGRHTVSAGGSQPQVMAALALEPLSRLGLPFSSIDDFATELHNPEITEPQGSGNVPERNYRTIAALAVKAGDIERADIADFVLQHGMPGYAPTQGHLASSLCYLPHAVERLTSGTAERVMLIAKGSLFLGRMSQLSDGMSVLLERQS